MPANHRSVSERRLALGLPSSPAQLRAVANGRLAQLNPRVKAMIDANRNSAWGKRMRAIRDAKRRHRLYPNIVKVMAENGRRKRLGLPPLTLKQWAAMQPDPYLSPDPPVVP